MRRRTNVAGLVVLALGLSWAAARQVVAADLDPDLRALALSAAERADRDFAVAKPALLTIIDYSLPSTEKRLWILDRTNGAVIRNEWVAHGSGSGQNLATTFSNAVGSRQSSLGLFLTQETYVGSNGYSLRLRGLEAGVNHLAAERAIVVHGATYVSEAFIRHHGRLGRSWGCPALRAEIARDLIDEIKGGSLVFAYYPDPAWLAASTFLADAILPAG